MATIPRPPKRSCATGRRSRFDRWHIRKRGDRFMLSLPSFLRPWRRRPPTCPAVRLAGVIGSVGLAGRGLTLAGLERALDAAFAHKRAPAVALLINSPGGSPVQSALIAGRIRDLARGEEQAGPGLRRGRRGLGRLLARLRRGRDLRRPVLDRGLDRGDQRRVRVRGRDRPARASSAACMPPASARRMLDPFRAERPGDLELLQGDPGRHPGAVRRSCPQPPRRAAQGQRRRAVRRPGLDRRRRLGRTA